MRAGDTFTIVNHGKTSFDAECFSALYLPIVERDAFALYQLLRNARTGKISHFLESLNLGISPFIEALDKLSALDLVRVFDNHPDLYFELVSPLSYENFLADEFYKRLLISRIGEARVAELSQVETPLGQNISRKFHEVYAVNFDRSFDQVVKSEKFDIGAFKALMTRQELHFADENQDILTLYSLAEKFALNWYELFKIVEQTANADKSLNLTASMRQLSAKTQPIPTLSTFPKAFQDLIIASKSAQPADFLRQIKQQAGGFVSNDELKLLTTLSKQNLPTEVQNVLIHYILIQQKNPTLTSNFVNTVANDWLRQKIGTAEAAILRILERNQLAQEKTKAKAPAAKLVKKAPKWSNENYVERTSSAEQAEFERYKQQRKKHQEDN